MDAVGWITWFLHGILQSILLWAPLVEPLKERELPHPWFDPCEIYGLWVYLLDADGRPTAEFMDLYWECLWSKFRGGIVDQYLTAIFNALLPVWQMFGDLGDEHGTVGEWLWSLWFKIGEVLPDWAFDVASGLIRLWELIPEPIRDGLSTWAEFVMGAAETIREWVIDLLGMTIEWVIELWEWYVEMGITLTEWWEWAHDALTSLIEDAYGWIVTALGEAWAFLVWFWSNPTGAITSWLSPWWAQLVTFATDCLDFWYNLWGSYAEDLADFLSDPMEFLYNLGEDWINERLDYP